MDSLLSIISQIQNGSLSVSPISYQYFLGVLSHGTSDKDMKRLFSSGLPPSNKKDMIVNNDIIIKNYIVINEDLKLNKNFKKICNTNHTYILKHIQINDKSKRKLNKDAQKYGFDNLFDVLNGDIVIVNIVNFRGKWSKSFKSDNTKTKEFVSDLDTVINLPMMNMRCKHRFSYKDDKLMAIKKYFTNGFCMEFVSGLSKDSNIPDLNYDSKHIDLWLPKFDLTTEIDFDTLRDDHIINQIFECTYDGFCDQDVKISKIKQCVYISVSEYEVAVKAKTYGTLIANCAPPKYILFIFDKPFRYRIYKDDIVIIDGYFNGK